MTGPRARALTFEALVQLDTALRDAGSPSDFLAAADHILSQEENLLDLPFDTGTPDALVVGDGKTEGIDANNAPAVYEFLGPISRANASDRRLWTYLAFATYRGYTEQRWPLDESAKWKDRARNRWLLGAATLTTCTARDRPALVGGGADIRRWVRGRPRPRDAGPFRVHAGGTTQRGPD